MQHFQSDQASLERDHDQQRIAIAVEYNGSQFHGWQRQTKPAVPTIQQCLEQALSTVADHPVSLTCAGRTDAGVHAVGQLAHFDVSVSRELKAWVKGANSLLPASIRVLWAQHVDQQFHARFSAQSRRYQYWIHNSAERSGIFAGLVTHYPQPLDHQLMHDAAQSLLGEQDFTSFRALACESPTAMRNVYAVKVFRQRERVCIDIEANAFLLHMVRNISGSLMEIGAKRQPVSWLKTLLAAKDRSLAAATARPDGLYLMAVSYPTELVVSSSTPSIFSQ
ncbi:MAG: tRNA pseudouridine(38-40) synthase TruA [Cellvibrionales bacterium]|jgi:tRNA pseudouridine38-40 synthase|nr:tRNA pseudouridine(38-40) synthase TruA [Cellvibrionales bacterium]HCH20780.1 tRNA pseudouridine(38-40) synthase TruA [Cellvibrionales bacterium]